MRVAALIVCLGALVLSALPAQAASALPPGHQPVKYTRWTYPSQMNYGPLETGVGSTGMAPARGAFLTLPFMGPHYITSIFDHCYPDYQQRPQICRYDGTVASVKVGGPDPTFDAGYAQSPGGHDYLYYSGHDGYDYGLFYEPVAAAAPGRVILANWIVPGCHTCLSGQTVEIDHGNGLMTFYGHLSHIWVDKGQYVSRGQVLGISGMTGTATGPHLHFGVYYTNGRGPVDPYGWGGSSPDPYGKDQGDLWLTGSPRFADVALPQVTVTAVPDPAQQTAIDVSWSSPGDGTVFTVYYVSPDGAMHSWTGSHGAGSAKFAGKRGQDYWFWARVTTSLGWSAGGGSGVVTIPRTTAEQPVS
ncbi:MAG TPA: M23 family metallopeptidase [Candidatus Udaeobacter sp.]|nr:M23 family metallopeptidase [Candidatus Udaeobacter sp.]